MHLVIINASPRIAFKSNTELILESFCKGLTTGGSTWELWHLSSRTEWQNARDAIAANAHILIALPLYVENVPGILLEFLASLPQEHASGAKIAFLIQGGFEEAAQAACAKSYVETLPAYFGCEYAGTLTKGGMFGARLLPEKLSGKSLVPFEAAGREFARTGCFSAEYAKDFAGPEYIPAAQIRKYEHFGCHLSKLVMNHIAKKLGCREKLDAQPYTQKTNGQGGRN